MLDDGTCTYPPLSAGFTWTSTCGLPETVQFEDISLGNVAGYAGPSSPALATSSEAAPTVVWGQARTAPREPDGERCGRRHLYVPRYRVRRENLPPGNRHHPGRLPQETPSPCSIPMATRFTPGMWKAWTFVFPPAACQCGSMTPEPTAFPSVARIKSAMMGPCCGTATISMPPFSPWRDVPSAAAAMTPFQCPSTRMGPRST